MFTDTYDGHMEDCIEVFGRLSTRPIYEGDPIQIVMALPKFEATSPIDGTFEVKRLRTINLVRAFHLPNGEVKRFERHVALADVDKLIPLPAELTVEQRLVEEEEAKRREREGFGCGYDEGFDEAVRKSITACSGMLGSFWMLPWRRRKLNEMLIAELRKQHV